MYLEHYGFSDKPFRLNHDPAYYYGEAHQIPLNELCYSIEERHGLAILLGEAGTGKTTLLLRLVRSFADTHQGVFLSDMAVNDASLLRQVARALRIPFKPQDPTEVVTQYLDIFLRGRATEGKTVVVLLDEAQSLSKDQFDEIRYLTNLEHRGNRLVEIVLAGLPSLERRLGDPELEAVDQRATVRCWVEPFSRDQVTEYVKHRLRVVRAPNVELFGGQALDRVYMASRGIPRLINIICERALLVGYVEESRDLNESLVEQAISDLRIRPPAENQANTDGALSLESNLLVRMADQMDAMKKQLDRLETAMGQQAGGTNGPSIQSRQATEMARVVRAVSASPGGTRQTAPMPSATPTVTTRNPVEPVPHLARTRTSPGPTESGSGDGTKPALPPLNGKPVHGVSVRSNAADGPKGHPLSSSSNGTNGKNGNGHPSPTRPTSSASQDQASSVKTSDPKPVHASRESSASASGTGGPVPLSEPEQLRVNQWLSAVKHDNGLSQDPSQKTVEIVPPDTTDPAKPSKPNSTSAASAKAKKGPSNGTEDLFDDLVEDMDVIALDGTDSKTDRW